MDYKIAVIGAGVVGLAIAAHLSQKYKNLVVLEKYEKFGQETSSRNSEVVHSGIYYPKNSLKAKLCIQGRHKLYNFCKKNNVGINKCGKILIATNEIEKQKLIQIIQNAKDNGVEGIKLLDKNQINEIEPNIFGIAGGYFTESGIVDSHALMKKLETIIYNNNADIAYNSEVYKIKRIKNGYEITIKDNAGDFSFTSEILINSAGLFADKIAQIAGCYDTKYEIFFWKGQYFSIGNGKNHLVKKLIYPVPTDNSGLGIHTVSDLGGGLKIGPDSNLLKTKILDYKVDVSKQKIFFDSVKKFLPFIEEKDLFADQAGIRPKLTNNKNTFCDFIIKNEIEKNYKNFINLIGIESPGLTASLAIAEYVEKIII
jgi:L-2-hydroxyglutarate oxidase LhgO